MSHVVYYCTRHNLLYLFTNTDQLRLDIDTIANVQAGKSTLYFIFYTDRSEYAVMNHASELCTYAQCSYEMFTEWYENQSLLDIFIRTKGIHPVMCKRIITPSVWSASGAAVVAGASVPAPVPAPPAPSPEQKVKPHLVALVLRDAIAAKKVCSITLDPITNDSVCIAPCYHCFSKEAIEEWLLKNSTCPECRERCV